MMIVNVDLPSRSTVSTSLSGFIVKLAAKLLSVSLMPMPTLDYFMAKMSLAPSPTMATLLTLRRNIRRILPDDYHSLKYLYFIMFTMRALFYGDILAKTRTDYGSCCWFLRNALSMMMGVSWVIYSSWVIVIFLLFTLSPSFITN